MHVIRQFNDKYRCFSNFYPFDNVMIYDGDNYFCNEQFFVAMKTLDKEERRYISNMRNVQGIKNYGRQLNLRANWETVKSSVMEYGLKYKFSEMNMVSRMILVNTGRVKLEEGNHWGDTYWGICRKTGIGSNHLGKLLMKVRAQIISSLR